MAIAIWRKNHHDHSWMVHLASQGVPSSWIDTLQNSAIARFEHGMRVGAFVDPQTWPALPHLAALRRSKVPIFVEWKGQRIVDDICHKHHFMADFAPRMGDAEFAWTSPPLPSAPHTFFLFWEKRQRFHPPHAGLGAPYPAGPYQRRAESCEDFICRMYAKVQAAIATESDKTRDLRLCRQLAAAHGDIPKPWIPVYIWLKFSDIYSDCSPNWVDADIRCEVPSTAVAGLWRTHGRHLRYYNPLHDEWDLVPQPIIGISELFSHGTGLAGSQGEAFGLGAEERTIAEFEEIRSPSADLNFGVLAAGHLRAVTMA
ncbi:hypothetical protein C8Q76DRAFT_688006 [Earliella scabrosa]|nr:hypothetical protein C8Q76DRAFT_688006 [Earliella scabrosa]